MSQLAAPRSLVYELLASVYNTLPNAGFITNFVNYDVPTLFNSAIGEYSTSEVNQKEIDQGILALGLFQRQVVKTVLDELSTRLGVDRARLLRGIKRGYGPPPPYECVYLGGHIVMGEATIQVKNLYANAGYISQIQGNEPPDYIGIEIGFLSFLCSKEAEAWRTNNPYSALEFLKREGDFLSDHVVKWVPKFCEEAIPHATESFYQSILKLTKAYISIESERCIDFINNRQ